MAGFEIWGGSCYSYVEATYDWEGANDLCAMMSAGKAVPASISSQAENDYVASLFDYKNGLDAWIGGTYLSSNMWAWVDGSSWTGYTNWNDGEPTNVATDDKIVMYGRSSIGPLGSWKAMDDSTRITGFVCEYKPTTTNTTATSTTTTTSATTTTLAPGTFDFWLRKEPKKCMFS